MDPKNPNPEAVQAASAAPREGLRVAPADSPESGRPGADGSRDGAGSPRDGEARALASLSPAELLAEGERLRAENGRLLVERESARDESARLRDASEEKDAFLDMVAHELRDPLAPIATLLQLLKLRGETALQEERAVLERHSAHLVLLVDDLLDAARITGGRMVLKKERVELSAAISNALELTRPMLERLRHRLIVTLGPGLTVEADKRRLTQMLTGLITNAAKHTESGGALELIGEKRGGLVTLRARFERFVQNPSSEELRPGALGLGFTVVERLALLHGGLLSMELDPSGQGAEFLLELPAAPRALSAVPDLAPEPELRAEGNGLRVLIVDDNEDAADMLSFLLDELGYATFVAHDGATALQLAEDEKPDVALLDLRLPVMDGYQLARKLRESPRLRGIKLLAVTGYGQESERQRTQAEGFDGHLVKPIDAAGLVKTLDGLFPRQE